MIGTSRRRPKLEDIRRIKKALREALSLSEETTVTLAELACLEEGCAPIETVIGLLRPDAPQVQYKLHKAVEAIDAEDLFQVCTAWGFNVEVRTLAALL